MSSPPKERQSIPTSSKRQVFYAVSLIAVVLVIGTVGFNEIEGMRWVDAFYMESMLATGQGPPISLNTDAGKIFASIMGFVSIGSVITAIVFTLAPMVSQIWKESLERMELRMRTVEEELAARTKKLEGE